MTTPTKELAHLVRDAATWARAESDSGNTATAMVLGQCARELGALLRERQAAERVQRRLRAGIEYAPEYDYPARAGSFQGLLEFAIASLPRASEDLDAEESAALLEASIALGEIAPRLDAMAPTEPAPPESAPRLVAVAPTEAP